MGGSSGNPGSGATAGSGIASGGAPGFGGTAGTVTAASGGLGMGGRVGTGGTAGTSGNGGIVGSGGGGGGSGGAMSACQPNATQCAAGNLQTCGANGQWAAATSCGAHRTCTGPVGTAQCACNSDPTCKSIGSVCSGTTALVSCAMDGNGCFYQASSMTCSNGACSGNACCTNACTAGAVQGSGCGMQICQMGANGCLAWSLPMAGACTAPLVCERYSGPVCGDPDWAEWPIPPDSPTAYTDNGDGTVTDTVTKLMWQKAVAPGTFTRSAGAAYCTAATTGGHNDWRLPSVIEIFSIVDHTVSTGPTINSVFGPTTADSFWTSTGVGTIGLMVSFGNGTLGRNGVSAMLLVRCVR